MKQYKLSFMENEKKSEEMAYIGGKSLLPDNIAWPKNPDEENLVLIMTISTAFLNKYFNGKFTQDKIISVFTTFKKDDYFLDLIVYNGDDEELKNIQSGFTKVIFHDMNSTPRNESEYEIPKKGFDLELLETNEEYGGSKIGGEPYLLQKNPLKTDNFYFVLQIYGNDFPEEYNGIFYLSDSIGYLYLNENDDGIFFTQCT